MARPTLTVRAGPEVARERFETIDEAVAALRERAEEIRSAGRLGAVKAIRDYEPSTRVRARLEISAGRALRRREAGVDVMGDGSLVAYRGGITRRALPVPEDGDPYEPILAALGR